MYIRKYTAIVIGLIIISLSVFIFGYQYIYSKDSKLDMEQDQGAFRFTKVNGSNIEVYKDGNWTEMKIKGVALSSFTPKYGRYKTGIDKALVMQWLEEIQDLGANVVKIPSIQPSSFYNAIYDYNQLAETPIYTIHEVMLDENAVLKYYDMYNKKIWNNFKQDIKKTINVVHGRSAIFSNKRNHAGIYLKDISKYNLGYILGTNTNPEAVTLTDLKYSNITSYEGKNLSMQDGSAFESFVAEMMDYSIEYEKNKFKQISLISYLTDITIDPLSYKHEPNQSRKAKVNVEKIKMKNWDNLFVAYNFHPNSVSFLDYEYNYKALIGEEDLSNTKFYKHLKRLNRFYDKPIILTEVGMSSSRGISKVDIIDGFNRGGFSEIDQGKNIVKLLKIVDESSNAGVFIRSWQDDWTSYTGLDNMVDYLDENSSSYWYDSQSSDESFGLVKFENGAEDRIINIDGLDSEWKDEDYIINSGIKLKVKSDLSYLYLLIQKENWSLDSEKIYIGLDISQKSGSKLWEEENIPFSLPVDFIVALDGYNDSRILVHERYNIFNYLYKYYSQIVDMENIRPSKESTRFSGIYVLNRKKFYFTHTDKIIEPIYYETGKLVHGNGNPEAEEYNSLTDFSKNGDFLELRIPWSMINIKNSTEMIAYDDFYEKGVEEGIKIDHIGFSIYDRKEQKIYSEDKSFKLKKEKVKRYKHSFKESYYILQDFWLNNM